jgi:hypothetical protein
MEGAPIEQASVQWHLAQMLGEVELTPQQSAAACRILKRNLAEKKDWIVVNYQYGNPGEVESKRWSVTNRGARHPQRVLS